MAGNISNAVSTGGAGTVLEHRYAASWIVLLLCHGEPPFFPGGRIAEVSVQAGSLFWKTDDVLVRGVLPGGLPFNVAAQVKRMCTAVESDEDFAGFIAGAWTDFNDVCRFNHGTDRLLLVSSFQSAGLYRFRQLIEHARANPTAADWIKKLQIPKFLSKEVAAVKGVIATIVAKSGVVPTDDQLWDFLRHCGLILTDLGDTGGSHEAQIVSLLRTTCADAPPAAPATDSWNELCTLTAAGEGVAKTFRLADLPEPLRRRHSRARVADLQLLVDLRRNTEMVIAGCRDTINGVALDRTALEADIADALASNRVVLLTGPAGSGKSALAKRVFRTVTQDALALAFRVEEFAATNLRDSPAMHGCDLGKLLELSALFGKRVVLVESVERLLEDSRRDAFLDFLRQLAGDPTWHLILTCRSSASVTVEQAFLKQAGLTAVIRSVPPFTDAELEQFATSLPQVMRPLSSPALRELLRQPFLLEKAAALSWPESEPLPTSEREFRHKVWTEVIRNDALTMGGLPQRRAEAFGQIGLRRAKELAPYVRATGLDAEAVQKLCDDGLVVRAAGTAALVAPAHDVLEDWALLQWLDEEFQLSEAKLLPLVENLEPFPALRRAFRKWLLEHIDAAPALSGKNIISVIRAPTLAQQWRDETIATVLRSSQAGNFVRHSAVELLADGGTLLFRCLHLCRVAATGRSQTLPMALGRLSLARVPDGSGWIAMAELLSTHLALVSTGALVNQVAYFVSDWCRGVTPATPYPGGSVYFARIALDLLKRGEANYRVSPAERMLAESVLKIPLAEEVELVRQIRHSLAHERFNRNGGGLHELALNFTHGAALARDLPELVVECQTAYLTPQPVNKHDPWARHHRREVAEYFGLPPFLALEDATASAMRGPFLNLFFAHPTIALDAIILVINRAARSYADTSAEGGDALEPPEEVEIELPDGTRKKILGGWRLWAIYRGASVAPYVLQSALMALEMWLLGKAEQKDPDLAEILQQIVLRTNNVALLAVVASVAVAHPEPAGVAAYCVLTHPSFYHLDIARTIHESTALETIGGFSLRGDLDQRLAVDERRASRKRAHRSRTVEDLCRALQTTELQARVWALLDQFRAEAGGAKPADTDKATWLNIIHRMDLREFRQVARKDGHDYFSPGPLPAGVEEKLAPARPVIEASEVAVSVLNWGIAAFKRDLKPAQAAQWREMLARALAIPLTIEDERSFAPAGAAHVCAVALRDHAQELTETETIGCEERVAIEILKQANTNSDMVMCQNHEISGDRPAAYVASTLLRRSPEDVDLRRLVAIALTHPVDQVRFYAAAGYREAFADSPEELRLVLSAFAAGIRRYAELEQAEEGKDWQQRRDSVAPLIESLAYTRKLIESPKTSDLSLVETLRYDDTSSRLFVATVASWLSQRADWPEAMTFFTRNTARLVARMEDSGAATDVHGETEQVFEQALADYALSLPTHLGLALLRPVTEAARKASHDVSMFLWSLAIQAEMLGRVDQFWALWEAFAQVALTLPAADYQDDDHLHRDLLSKLFLHLDGAVESDWALIRGRESTFTKFYAALPATADVTGFYLHYLNRYGKSSLPAAFVVVAQKLAGDPNGGQLNANNVLLLERILTPRVFGSPQELKSDPEVRAAVIAILDSLVDAGSAAAYLMRDDFATPQGPERT